jgi:hypothetical protein
LASGVPLPPSSPQAANTSKQSKARDFIARAHFNNRAATGPAQFARLALVRRDPPVAVVLWGPVGRAIYAQSLGGRYHATERSRKGCASSA